MKEDLELMYELMNGITQTDTWTKIQHTDPMVKEAMSAFDASLDKLKGTAQEDLIDELYEAAIDLACAFDYPAILYGMRVAQTIQNVTANPIALSQHLMDRAVKYEESRE